MRLEYRVESGLVEKLFWRPIKKGLVIGVLLLAIGAVAAFVSAGNVGGSRPERYETRQRTDPGEAVARILGTITGAGTVFFLMIRMLKKTNGKTIGAYVFDSETKTFTVTSDDGTVETVPFSKIHGYSEYGNDWGGARFGVGRLIPIKIEGLSDAERKFIKSALPKSALL